MVPIRYVLFINGILLFVLACAMLFPAMLDFSNGDPDWQVFIASSISTAFIAGLFVLGFKDNHEPFTIHTGYFLTVSSWLTIGFFGSLPLLYSSLNVGITDAVFETLSALTTTGSTILSGLDTMPHGILLWRSFMQWLGGVGIVAMAIILLPMLRIGGMQLFRTESSSIEEKTIPRLSTFAGVIAAVYLGLTTLCAVALYAAGMNPFDAVNHAMTTIATGGFSTKDASIGYFDSPLIEGVIIVFMTLSALPLALYAYIVLRGWRAIQAETQAPTFLIILVLAVAMMTAWNWLSNGDNFLHALRISAFNVTSVLTDTGFGSADFSQWGPFPVGLMFALLLIGGCAGSTSGAIKIFRWQLLITGIRNQLLFMLKPHRVLPLRYGERSVSPEMMVAVRNFFFLYIITLGGLSLALMATGMDFLAASSAVAQAMANAGPGLTQDIGPAGNFAHIPDGAKWLLVMAMLLGRLELATVYVMILRSFWVD